ncbi:MAG: YbhN family protein [Desulfosudaceae bacterium]
MIKHSLRILFSCLLFVYFGLRVDWQMIASVFGRVDIFWYLISTVITLSGSWFMAGKYYLLLRKTSLALSLSRLLVIQFISRFYALFLPTALGPEAVRWYKVTRHKEGKSFFLAVTAYERILFLLMLLVFGMVPLLVDQQQPGVAQLLNRLVPVVTAIGLVLLAGLLYLFHPGAQTVVRAGLKKALRVRKGGKIDSLLTNLSLKDTSMTLLLSLVVLTLGWQLFFIGRIYGLFQAMGLSFGLAEAAWMGSLVLLLQVLPISFAGLGIREGAYGYLVTLYGLPAEEGFVLGLLFFTQMMVFALIGAVLNLFEK